jgi:hypothetical protein
MTNTNLIGLLEDAAYDWTRYVIEDTAPCALNNHLAPYIKALADTIEAQTKRLEALSADLKHTEECCVLWATDYGNSLKQIDALQVKVEHGAIAELAVAETALAYTQLNAEAPNLPAQPAQGEPPIPFRHGCKWCGRTKCAEGCPALLQSKPAEPVNQVLLDALRNLLQQVDSFCTAHGEVDFETAEAHKAIAQAQTAKREPLDVVNCDTCRYHYKDVDQKPGNTCIHSGDFGSNFEPRFEITKGQQ